MSGIPKAVRDKLFEKRLIIFVTNPNISHWCCTFIFNLRQYIINLENDVSVLPNEDTFEIAGYFEFDPLEEPTNYKKATDKEGLFEFLYVVYENLWNRTKPKEEWATTNPIDFKRMIMMENSGFYQMKCKSFFIAKQHDGYNCSLGVMLAMLRFMNAFNDNIVSKNWIATEETISKAVIPSRIFASNEYNFRDTNHLNHVRIEVFNSIDTLSEILCKRYKETRLQDLFKAMLASPIYQETQLEDTSLTALQLDYIIRKHDWDTYERDEVQRCKHAFATLDETKHEFVTVPDDGNAQSYIFGAILKVMDIDSPKDGRYLTIFIRKGIQEYWKDLSDETKKKYFYKANSKEIRRLVGIEVFKESMNLDSIADDKTKTSVINNYYKSLNALRKTPATLNKHMTELYITDTSYVDSVPIDDGVNKNDEDKKVITPKDKQLFTRLFAMKYKLNIVFVQCRYDGKKDHISGEPTPTKFTLHIYDEEGRVINISQPSTSLPDFILHKYHFVIFLHQDYKTGKEKIGPAQKFKLLINKFPSENLFKDEVAIHKPDEVEFFKPTEEDLKKEKKLEENAPSSSAAALLKQIQEKERGNNITVATNVITQTQDDRKLKETREAVVTKDNSLKTSSGEGQEISQEKKAHMLSKAKILAKGKRKGFKRKTPSELNTYSSSEESKEENTSKSESDNTSKIKVANNAKDATKIDKSRSDDKSESRHDSKESEEFKTNDDNEKNTEETNESEEEDITLEYFKCAASDLCVKLDARDWKSNMISKDTRGIKLCSECRYYAHKECLKKPSLIKKKSQRKDLVCLMCTKMYDGDGDPTVASLNPEDAVSKNNTIATLKLDEGSMTFEELMNNITKDNKRCKGYLNENKDADKFVDSYFGDVEMMSEKDYKENYTTYKRKLYKEWNFPFTVHEQQKLLKEWRQQVKSCTVCKEKWEKEKEEDNDKKRGENDCQNCQVLIQKLNSEPISWKAGSTVAKNRFVLSKPTLVRAIKHVKDDEWSIKIEFMGYNNKVKTEYLTVDTAFVKREYGPFYSKFVRLLPTQLEKKYWPVPKKNVGIRMNDKPIKAIKYIKGSLKTTSLKVWKEVPRKVFKEPIYNESLLSGQPPRKKKKDESNPGDQITAEKDTPAQKSHTMDSRLDKNKKESETSIPSRKKVATTQIKYIGGRHPGKWSVLYTDGTTSQDVDEGFLSLQYSKEYVGLLKNIGTSKYIPIPQGANKESHLYKWPDLIQPNAPKVLYTQEGKSDLCVSKAFSSVLYYSGFRDIAKKVNDKFNQKKLSFEGKDPNFKVICDFATPLLPNWMQLHNKHIHRVDWKKDIKQFDIFVGGILGSDGIANHAIAIHNNWIFDANENIAIPLCKSGLDYCVSTKDHTYEFVKFTSGFYYREQGKKKRLKRRMEDNSPSNTKNDRQSFDKKQLSAKSFPSSKLRKI